MLYIRRGRTATAMTISHLRYIPECVACHHGQRWYHGEKSHCWLPCEPCQFAKFGKESRKSTPAFGSYWALLGCSVPAPAVSNSLDARVLHYPRVLDVLTNPTHVPPFGNDRMPPIASESLFVPPPSTPPAFSLGKNLSCWLRHCACFAVARVGQDGGTS